jgi:hypothetical protein
LTDVTLLLESGLGCCVLGGCDRLQWNEAGERRGAGRGAGVGVVSASAAMPASAAVSASASVSPSAKPAEPASVEQLAVPGDRPASIVRSADGKPPRIVFLGHLLERGRVPVGPRGDGARERRA